MGFYFYHLNIYKQFTQEEIFESLLMGVRFDIAAIILMNAVVILLAQYPGKNPKFITFERVTYTVVNMIGFIMTIDDYELFLFMGKRLSVDLFTMTGDILDQLPQIMINFWYFPLASIVFGVGLYYFDKRFFKLGDQKWRPVHALASVLILGLSFVGIRGGLQHKSINVQSAFVQGKNELGHLVLNSPYHFLRTLKNSKLKPVKYFAKDDEAKNIILNQRDFRDGYQGKKNTNVVLIILESFALEYVEKGYAPFLSELIQSNTSFSKHLANGRRSIEALPSILCGLPSLIEEPISKSVYSGNKFNCFPKLLKEAGYTNYFFHAGSRGTMGFEAYTLANGFEKYFSREDYGNQDFDGTWGIYDLPYLQYVLKNINEMKQPFLAGVFTLSSHQPYSIPEEFKGKFPKGTLEIHESIGYTDYALRKFFEGARKEAWFKDTIFVITSDHSQKLETKKYQNLVGRYRVPLVIVGGEKIVQDKVTQHSDIPKTILDMVEVEGELAATSVSAFSGDKGAAVNFADGSTYFLATHNHVYTLEKSYSYDWETGNMDLEKGPVNPLLPAYLQYFLNGLLNNNLSLYR